MLDNKKNTGYDSEEYFKPLVWIFQKNTVNKGI